MMLTTFATGVYLSDDIYNLSSKETMLIRTEKTQSNYGGNSASTDRYVLNKHKSIKSFIVNEVNKLFYKKLNVNTNVAIDITQSWFNYNKKEKRHHNHNHRNSVISGIMYLQGTSGATVFKRPNDLGFASLFDFDTTQINEFNNNEFYIYPEIGKLILFPSMMEHYVMENKNDETRITLSFNTFFKGSFGVEDRLTKAR